MSPLFGWDYSPAARVPICVRTDRNADFTTQSGRDALQRAGSEPPPRPGLRYLLDGAALPARLAVTLPAQPDRRPADRPSSGAAGSRFMTDFVVESMLDEALLARLVPH